MPEYIVYTKEIVIQPVKIEAESAEEALEAAQCGEGEPLERETLEVVDPDNWTVTKIDEEGWSRIVKGGPFGD